MLKVTSLRLPIVTVALGAAIVSGPHAAACPVAAACSIAAVVASASGGEEGSPGAVHVDTSRLEREEDATEAIANELLAFSIAFRDGDFAGVESHFAEAMEASAPMPVEAEEPHVTVKWIAKHGWAKPAEPRGLSRDEFVAGLRGFRSHLRDLEDARFKISTSEFGAGEDRMKLGLKFFVVARDLERRREKVKGTAKATARKDADGRWRLDSFVPDPVESMVALREIFDEVGLPAGVAETLPRFDASRSGIVAHGVAAADFDGDGRIDVFTTGATRNRLLRNVGDGRFEDVAEAAGIAFAPTATGPVTLDYDQDGDADLFLAAIGHPMLFENRRIPDGRLSFRDVSIPAGVGHAQAVGFSAVAGDVNRDGFPDLYVCSYNRYGDVMPESWDRATNGTPNLLFVNRKDGTFREEAETWGVADRRWSYAAEFVDVDEDGDQDLFVANDYGEKGLYVNQGDRFVDEAAAWGCLDRGNGMGVSFGDYDNDGDLDLHVTNMASTAGNRIIKRLFPQGGETASVLKKLAVGNTLLERVGPREFRDVSADVGGLWGGWGWGGGFCDFDNDGWEDVHSTNGFISGDADMKDT